jgi:dUTP pyrophosphatase
MRFAKLYPGAFAPTRKHPTDAGMDVYAFMDTYIGAGEVGVVKTGITVEVPDGYCLQVWPKGRSNFLIGAGIIDAGYQGEIVVKVFNTEPCALFFREGDPVAQLVMVPVVVEPIEECALHPLHALETRRGASGGIHGSA